MSENEAKVLDWLRKQSPGFFYPFAPIVEEIGLPRTVVRRTCRSLKRKGLVEFAIGLSDYDGNFKGSGYRANPSTEISHERE